MIHHSPLPAARLLPRNSSGLVDWRTGRWVHRKGDDSATYREGPETSRSFNYLQQAGRSRPERSGRTGRSRTSTWGFAAGQGAAALLAAGVAASLQFRQEVPMATLLAATAASRLAALGGCTAGRGAAAGQARGAAQQAGAQQLFSQQGWQQASLAFSSAKRWRWHFGRTRNRRPPRSTWGLHSRPERRPPERRRTAGAHSLGGCAAGRSAAALLAATMAAGQLGLQPLQEARTAALRHAAASRLTALGGFAAQPERRAFGASQQAGAQQLFSQQGWQQASLAFSRSKR